MELRPRTLRRALAAAALGALLVPATAGAAVSSPVITKVTPKNVSVGETLTVTGRNFRRGRGKNTVLFKRDGGKALFVKAGLSTTKQMQLVIPAVLVNYMAASAGKPAATRFRLRVLTTRLGKSYTSTSASPIVAPAKPAPAATGTAGTGAAGTGAAGSGVAAPVAPAAPAAPDGDCDGDGVLNSVDTDDDNDLLPDTLEAAIGTDPCNADTDGDGVEDGYEYKSAHDLNDDDYQDVNHDVPYPHTTPYPNPLFADANVDYDGDGLTLGDEYKLWVYTYTVNHTATRTLFPLSYSDGMQYSLSTLNADGRRVPSMTDAAYLPPQLFRAWASTNGYANVWLWDVTGNVHGGYSAFDLFDDNRDGTVTQSPVGNQLWAENHYWDLDDDGYVSDDERDEDADGLTNYDETGGRMSSGYWASCYAAEKPYPITYAGTSPTDPDSDGDGILDGADDQDHDDIPNVMELSRNMASGRLPGATALCNTTGVTATATPEIGRVNPFNPCLPDRNSRTCERHPGFGGPFAPYDGSPDYQVLN